MLIRHTLLYMPAQLVGPLFQLIAMIAWTHLVDEHTLGLVTLITATHELLQIGFISWWSQYALRVVDGIRDDATVARFQRTENMVLLASVIAQGVAAAIILLTLIAPDASNALIAATLGYVATRSLNVYLGERARAQQQIGIYTIQQISGPAIGFFIGLALIALIGPDAEWPLMGYAVAQLGAALVVLPRVGLGTRLWPVDRIILRHAVRYGVPIVLGGALGWIGLNASRFIISHLLGIAAAGLFAVGYGLGQRAAAVAAMLVNAAAFPLAVRRMEEHGSKAALAQLSENGALLAALLAPSVVGIFMLRVPLVELLIAQPFRDATLAVLPIAVLAGALRNFRAHFCDQVFLLQKQTWFLIAVAGIDAAVGIAAGVALVTTWGIAGGAAASVASALAAMTVSVACGMLVYGLRLPIWHLLRIGGATTAMAAVLALLSTGTGVVGLVLAILLGAVVYVAAMSLLYSPLILTALRARQRSA
jgi:O-antigen/teichoic acid export membrane protein